MMKPSARNQIKGRVTAALKGHTTGHAAAPEWSWYCWPRSARQSWR